MLEITINRDGIEALAGAIDVTERAFIRFGYALAEETRARAIRNADNNFGNRAKNNPDAKWISGRKLGASGNLRNSIMVDFEKARLRWFVNAGNSAVPYARIHEFGGPIEPVKAKWLTIPVHPVSFAQRAREFDLRFVPRNDTLAFLFFSRSVKQTARRKARKGELAYVLKKHVDIPARPYMRPALGSVASDANFLKMQLKLAFAKIRRGG